jgi:hypothetical protein
MKNKFFFSLLLTVLSIIGQAQNYNISKKGFYLDNDFFLEKIRLGKLDEDRNYTMGIGFFYGDNEIGRKKIFVLVHIINGVFSQHLLNDSSNYHSITLANGSFTPDNLRSRFPIYNDRSYGSVTAFQFGVSGFGRDKKNPAELDLRHRKTASFSAGILGTRISEWTQTKIHSIMNDHNTKPPYNPEGWPNQISDNGEPTLLYTLQHDFLLQRKRDLLKSLEKGWGLQAKYGYRYSLGYLTGINTLFQFRLGYLNKRNWFDDVNNLQQTNHIAKQFAEKANNNLVNGHSKEYYKQPKTSFEFYLFGALRPQFVLYNALLNGQFRKSVHTISFQDTRHFFVEMDGGLGITVPFCRQTKSADLKIRASGRSPEFHLAPRSTRWHYWAGFELIFTSIKENS